MIRIKRQILVVENDFVICQSIYNGMQDNLTDICYMTSAMEALASYMTKDYCLVILDIQLLDVDGMELLRTIRSVKHTPILALTDTLSDKKIVELFCAGADAYIKKPLNVDLCIVQAKALMQRYIDEGFNYKHHDPVIHRNELIISPRYRQVIVEGKPLTLTRKEFDMLYCLAKSPGQVFTPEQLYSHVWNEDIVMSVDTIIKTHIKTLRKKLTQVGKNYIQNSWGVGYKFVLSD